MYMCSTTWAQWVFFKREFIELKVKMAMGIELKGRISE